MGSMLRICCVWPLGLRRFGGLFGPMPGGCRDCPLGLGDWGVVLGGLGVGGEVIFRLVLVRLRAIISLVFLLSSFLLVVRLILSIHCIYRWREAVSCCLYLFDTTAYQCISY